MGAYGAGVDRELPHDVADRVVFDDDLVEDPVPRAVGGPAPQPFVPGLPRSVALRQVAPRCTGAQLPQNSVDHLAVITPLAAATTPRRQQRLDTRPRRVGQLPTPNHARKANRTPARFAGHALVVMTGDVVPGGTVLVVRG